MSNEKMGQFISEMRKFNQMTQKDLAAKLNVTDKAVSKWERGLSYPDISLLSPISDILGVTTSELLNGQKNNIEQSDIEVSIDDALQYADKAVKSKSKSIQSICSASFSILLFLGIVVCTICDFAISGGFTWSLFPISSSVFAWLVFFPAIKFGKRGVFVSLISLSVLIVPFLWVLNNLIKVSDLILPVGIRMSIISLLFLWSVFGLFKILKSRKLIAYALSLLLMAFVNLLINVSLSKMFAQSLVDVWDVISFFILIISSAILFFIYFSNKKRRSNFAK